jgi:hypothetical protein
MRVTTTPPTVWPALRYRDARAAIRFLVEAFGFEERLVVPGEGDRDVVHAELRWPPGGRGRGGAGPQGRGLRLARLHRARPRGEHLELRHLPRGLSAPRP